MAPCTSILQILPILNEEGHPEQANRKEEQKQTRQPNKRPVP